VNVIPSNQTLILAGERGTRGAVGGSVLQRVTIVASRPDDTLLYLRADYSANSSTAEYAERAASSLTAPAGTAMVTVAGRAVTVSPRSGGPYGGSRGIELYASTQRNLTARTVANVDVHA
jgi:hypothetical protein